LDYDTTLISQDIRNLIDIPNIGNTLTALAVPQGSYPANQDDFTSTSISKTINMGISPEKLTEIAFKSGTLNYSMNLSPANSKFLYAVSIAIPEFISDNNGQGFSQEVYGSGSLNLSGYTFKSATANKFTLKLTLIFKKNSQAVVISPGTDLNVTVSFSGMDFNHIIGFFGDQVAYPAAQSIEVPTLGTSLHNSGTISFANPTIDFIVTNDYGVPLTVSFSSLDAKKTGATLVMQTSPASPIPITAPATLGSSAATTVPVTNVKSVIDFKPTSFYYKVSGHINTGLTSGTNFMADTSKMRVRMHIQVPFYGKASNIILRDTIDVGLNDVDQLKIDSATLKVNVINELPLDAKLQFVLMDESNHFLDSLLTTAQSSFVKGSSVDSNGELSASGVDDEFIPLTKDKTAKLLKTKRIIMIARMNTIKNESGVPIDVKFKSQYKINIKLGLRTAVMLKNNS
jgi:hypothetical protein